MSGAGSGEGKKTLVEALHDKYTMEEVSDIKILVRLPKKAPGYSDEGKLIVPPILALNKCDITHAGDDSELKDLCANICELDLAENAIQEWREVFRVLSHCPAVTFLNLSKNELQNSSSTVKDAAKELKLSLEKLEKLVLNSLQLDWAIVLELLSVIPRIQELHLSLNNYNEVGIDTAETFPTVEKLYINGNSFCDWSEIAKFDQLFPNLQTLVMTENPITSIDSGSVEKTFPNLTSLNISQTQLKDWTEIENLRSFPKLLDVRLSSIPFMENLEEKPRRQRVIAYLPGVERLNGSPVGATEREDAERAFIRLYLDTEEKPKRCLELESVYGKLDPLAEVDLSSSSDIAQVLVVYEGKSKLVNIDITQTVRELKKKQLSEVVGLPPAKLRIFYRDIGAPRPHGDEELRFPNTKLYRFKVKTGDELHIFEK